VNPAADDLVAFFEALPADVRAEIEALAARDRELGERLEDDA